MSTKLSVNKIPLQLNEHGLRNLFSRIGTVTSATLVGCENGYRCGYVEYDSATSASAALQTLDGFRIGADNPLCPAEAYTPGLVVCLVEKDEDLENTSAADTTQLSPSTSKDSPLDFDVSLSSSESSFVRNLDCTEDSAIRSLSGTPEDRLKLIDRELYTVDRQGRTVITIVPEGQTPYIPECILEKETHFCSACGKECQWNCPCRKAFYCNSRCQRGHWAQHKLNCPLSLV